MITAPFSPKDRFDVYRYFNGLSVEGKEGLDRRRTRGPLVKTFLIEHVSCRGNGNPKLPAQIFKGLGADIIMLDDSFMGLSFDVFDEETQRMARETTGFLEQYDERFFAYYTCEKSEVAVRRVSRWQQNPDLDAAWFSSPLLQVLWDDDVSKRGDNRFGKLVFRHESIFDMPDDFAASELGAEETNEEDTDESASDTNEDLVEPDRRKARFEMGDRIGKISSVLKKLQYDYEPLNALYALRFPSRVGHGSHELFQTGQVTNRSDSFEEHRNTVRYLYRVYKKVLEFTEECAWPALTEIGALPASIKGVPLIVRFGEPISEATFDRWIQLAFQKRNRFKLWGDPIRLGPTKVHVYGADRHLWQPINLEITSRQIVAILPSDTCGNTFHRLVANIQQYVSPVISAWVGSESFETVVRTWQTDKDIALED